MVPSSTSPASAWRPSLQHETLGPSHRFHHKTSTDWLPASQRHFFRFHQIPFKEGGRSLRNWRGSTREHLNTRLWQMEGDLSSEPFMSMKKLFTSVISHQGRTPTLWRDRRYTWLLPMIKGNITICTTGSRSVLSYFNRLAKSLSVFLPRPFEVSDFSIFRDNYLVKQAIQSFSKIKNAYDVLVRKNYFKESRKQKRPVQFHMTWMMVKKYIYTYKNTH